MISLKQRTAETLSSIAEQAFPGASISSEEIYAMFEYPPDDAMGDLALPCFRLSKTLHRAPVQIADALAAGLADNPLFQKVEAVKGYLNFYFDGAALAAKVTAEVTERGETYGSPLN